MKKAALFFMYFIYLTCSAQGLFQRSYGNYNLDEGFQTLILSNHNYALVGISGKNVKLIIVDSVGNPKWSKEYSTFDTALYAFSCSFLATKDSGYIIASSFYRFSTNSNTRIYFFKVNSIGNIQWIRSYGGVGPGLNTVKEVISTSDSGYAMIGVSEDPYGFRIIIKTDSIGNLLWSKKYDPISFNTPHSIKQTPESDYVIACQAIVDIVVHGEVCLIKLDSAGNFKWSKTYGQGSQYDFASSIFITHDNYYLVTGYEFPTLFAMKTDTGGNLIWIKKYSYTGTSGPFGQGRGYKIIETGDLNYLITGVAGDNLYTDICLVKIDTSGNMIWGKKYGSSGVDIANDVVQKENDFLVLGKGSNLVRGRSDFYFFKVDSLGNSDCNYIDSIFTVQSLTWGTNNFGISTGSGVLEFSDTLLEFNSDTLNFNACECEPPTAFFTIGRINPNSSGVNIVDYSNWGSNWYWDFGDGNSYSLPYGHHWIPYNYSSPGVYIISLTVTNSCGSSTYLDTFDLITGGTDQISSNHLFSVYPNPFNNQAIFKVNSETIDELIISINDINGKEVFSREVVNKEAIIDKKNLSSGLYFLFCKVNGTTIFREKLVITD